MWSAALRRNVRNMRQRRESFQGEHSSAAVVVAVLFMNSACYRSTRIITKPDLW